MANVAFLGLGVMGYPMAGHLAAKGGHSGHGLQPDQSQGRTSGSLEHGGKSAATPKEAAAGQDIVFACVGADDDVRAGLHRAGRRVPVHGQGHDLRRSHHGLRLRSRVRCTRLPRPPACTSSMAQSPAVRRALKTARSPSCAAAMLSRSTAPSRRWIALAAR